MRCYLCALSSLKNSNTPKGYCDSCKEKLNDSFLTFNELNHFTGLLNRHDAFILIRKKKAKPRSLDSIFLLENASATEIEDFTLFYVFLLENGIKEINRSEAEELVKNGWATYVNEISIKMTIKRKDLIDSILFKYKRQCHFCYVATDCTMFILPEKDESIATPSNALCACPRCRTEYTKKDYFKWLNLNEELIDKTYTLLNFTKTKHYSINESDAFLLLNEHMAKKINDSTIYILYDRASFRQFIKIREKNQCHYCGKIGSTIDHVIPKSKEGLSTPDNCVWSCSHCNQTKANMSKDEFKEMS